MSVAFYISGHGFGHASRQVEIINALRALRPDVPVIIRSAVSAALLARTIRGPYDLRPGPCDSGVVQRDSITHDSAATIAAAVAFYRTFDETVIGEARRLAVEPSPVRAIVGDIPPMAFAVAARLGVPSVAIANFTWDWIYDGMPDLVAEAPWLGPTIRAAYGLATRALVLPFAGGMEVFPTAEALPLAARRSHRNREETRAHFGLPADRPVALLSFGGYGLRSLDLASVDCLPAWTIAVTDQTAGPNGASIPGVVRIGEAQLAGEPFRYEDLVGAADVVVTKPGYGIIAECAANGPALLYTSRGDFREYDVLVREMPALVRCRFITQSDLFAGRWSTALSALLRQPTPPRPAVDGADRAAAILSALV